MPPSVAILLPGFAGCRRVNSVRCFYCSSRRYLCSDPVFKPPLPPVQSKIPAQEERMQKILDSIKIKRTPLEKIIQNPEEQGSRTRTQRSGNEKFRYNTYTQAKKEAQVVAEIFHKKGVKKQKTQNELAELLASSFPVAPGSSEEEDESEMHELETSALEQTTDPAFENDEHERWRMEFDPFYQHKQSTTDKSTDFISLKQKNTDKSVIDARPPQKEDSLTDVSKNIDGKSVRKLYDPYLSSDMKSNSQSSSSISKDADTLSLQDLLESTYMAPSKPVMVSKSGTRDQDSRTRAQDTPARYQDTDKTPDINMRSTEAVRTAPMRRRTVDRKPGADDILDSKAAPVRDNSQELISVDEHFLKSDSKKLVNDLVTGSSPVEPELTFQQLLDQSYDQETVDKALRDQASAEATISQQYALQYGSDSRTSSPHQQDSDNIAHPSYSDGPNFGWRSSPRGDMNHRQQEAPEMGAFMFGRDRLNAFEPDIFEYDIVTVPSTWTMIYSQDLEKLVQTPVTNGFDEMIRLTEEKKLWKFPIDNEQGMGEEANVDFSEHIFLEKHCENFPEHERIQKFMKIVCLGLSKNPYMTLQVKISHINKFRTYFKRQFALLEKATLIEDELADD